MVQPGDRAGVEGAARGAGVQERVGVGCRLEELQRLGRRRVGDTVDDRQVHGGVGEAEEREPLLEPELLQRATAQRDERVAGSVGRVVRIDIDGGRRGSPTAADEGRERRANQTLESVIARVRVHGEAVLDRWRDEEAAGAGKRRRVDDVGEEEAADGLGAGLDELRGAEHVGHERQCLRRGADEEELVEREVGAAAQDAREVNLEDIPGTPGDSQQHVGHAPNVPEDPGATPERAGGEEVVGGVVVEIPDRDLGKVAAEPRPGAAGRDAGARIDVGQEDTRRAADDDEVGVVTGDELDREQLTLREPTGDRLPRAAGVRRLEDLAPRRSTGHREGDERVVRIENHIGDAVARAGPGECGGDHQGRRSGEEGSRTTRADPDAVRGADIDDIRVGATDSIAVGDGVAVDTVPGPGTRRHLENGRPLVVRLVEKTRRQHDRARPAGLPTDQESGRTVGVERQRRDELGTQWRAAATERRRDERVHRVPADAGVALIVDLTPEQVEPVEARVADRLARGCERDRVDHDVAAVAHREKRQLRPQVGTLPEERARCRLLRSAGVLVAGDQDVRDRVVGDVVDLARLQVAVEREPVACRIPWAGAAVDAAVVALDDAARGVEDHLAGVGVRRRDGRGAVMRQRGPLGRGNGAGSGDTRVSPEQATGVVRRTDRVRVRRERATGGLLLPVATDVNDERVGRIRDDRKVDSRLGARLFPRVDAGDAAASVHCPRQVHRDEEGLVGLVGLQISVVVDTVDALSRTEDPALIELAVVHHGSVDRVAEPAVMDGKLEVVRRRVDHRGGGSRDVRPGRSGVVTAVDAWIRAADDPGVEPRRVARVGDEIRRRAQREPGSDGTRDPVKVVLARYAVERAAEDAEIVQGEAIGRVDRDDDEIAARRDPGDVLAQQESVAVDHLPVRFRGQRVRRPQEPGSRATLEPERAVTPDPGDECAVGHIRRVELHGADGERRLVVGERRPARARRGGVRRSPDASVGRADPQGVGVGRMGDNRMDGADDRVVDRCGDVLDLPFLDGARPLGGPEVGADEELERLVDIAHEPGPAPEGPGSEDLVDGVVVEVEDRDVRQVGAELVPVRADARCRWFGRRVHREREGLRGPAAEARRRHGDGVDAGLRSLDVDLLGVVDRVTLTTARTDRAVRGVVRVTAIGEEDPGTEVLAVRSGDEDIEIVDERLLRVVDTGRSDGADRVDPGQGRHQISGLVHLEGISDVVAGRVGALLEKLADSVHRPGDEVRTCEGVEQAPAEDEVRPLGARVRGGMSQDRTHLVRSRQSRVVVLEQLTEQRQSPGHRRRRHRSAREADVVGVGGDTGAQKPAAVGRDVRLQPPVVRGPPARKNRGRRSPRQQCSEQVVLERADRHHVLRDRLVSRDRVEEVLRVVRAGAEEVVVARVVRVVDAVARLDRTALVTSRADDDVTRVVDCDLVVVRRNRLVLAEDLVLERAAANGTVPEPEVEVSVAVRIGAGR